jgi:hypothetical protein
MNNFISSPSTPVYKRPDHGKCYVAQTKQLVNVEEQHRMMKRAAKSVVTWDDMAFNYYHDCLTVLVFASSETATTVTATHSRLVLDVLCSNCSWDTIRVLMDSVYYQMYLSVWY